MVARLRARWLVPLDDLVGVSVVILPGDDNSDGKDASRLLGASDQPVMFSY